MMMVIQVISGESFTGAPVHFEVVRNQFLHGAAPTISNKEGKGG